MNRRSLLKKSLLLLTPSMAVVRPAKAEALTVGTALAAIQLTQAVVSYMNRGSDPTLELIISISDMLKATGAKIDAIDQKLEVLISQIGEIRTLLIGTSRDTVRLQVLTELREPWLAFLDKYKEKKGFSNKDKYYSDVESILNRLQIARRKYIDLSSQTAFDGAVNVALAYDAEMTIALELLTPDALSVGKGIAPVEIRSMLQAYERYFSAVQDPKATGSIAYLMAAARRDVQSLLDQPIEVAPALRVTAGSRGVEPATSLQLRSVLEGETLTTVCGHDGGALCLSRESLGKGCLEPGWRNYYRAKTKISRTQIAETGLIDGDELKYPFIYNTQSDTSCPDGTKVEAKILEQGLGRRLNGLKSADGKQHVGLNQQVVSYYVLLYTLVTCRAAHRMITTSLREFHSLVRA